MKVRRNQVKTRRSRWHMPPARGDNPVGQPLDASRGAADLTHPLSVRNIVEVAQIGFRQIALRLADLADKVSADELSSIVAIEALALDHADLLGLLVQRERQVERLVAEAEDVLRTLDDGQEDYRRTIDRKIQDLRNLDRQGLARASKTPTPGDSRYEAGGLMDLFVPGEHAGRAAELLRRRVNRGTATAA
jgi:hypothetical protein